MIDLDAIEARYAGTNSDGSCRSREQIDCAPSDIRALIAEVRRLERERDHYKSACISTAREIENTLGLALFGPQAPEDEAPAWCVYTSEELALLAAERIGKAERERDAPDISPELAARYLGNQMSITSYVRMTEMELQRKLREHARKVKL